MRIAIQGEAGSFHDIAARQWFGDDSTIVPAPSFRETFNHVQAGRADALVTAIENSLYGSINEVYDLVEISKFPIIGEVKLRIVQNLIGLANASPNAITHIYSHPVALAQCRAYLDEKFPHAERIEHTDTAESVAFIKQLGDPTCAAIASTQAAALHDLPILEAEIEDNAKNFTRFLVLKPDGQEPEAADRSSLVLTTTHQSGALAHVLKQFAAQNINLVKLQSRPILGQPWKYKFYLVVEATGQSLQSVVDQIEHDGNHVTVLGQYVSAKD